MHHLGSRPPFCLTYVRFRRTIVRNMITSKKQPVVWLFPAVRRQVLALLLSSSGQRWHLRDIARRTGFSVNTVRRELAGLTAAAIVLQVRDGNRTYYQANPSCPLLPELAGIMRKTLGLADVVREHIEPLASRVELAFIYGSQAVGEAKAGSDVDVLVVGDVDEVALHKALGKAEDQLGREVNCTVLNREDFRRRLREKGGFLQRVMSGPKLMLVGDPDEL